MTPCCAASLRTTATKVANISSACQGAGFIGAVVGELLGQRSVTAASQAGIGATVGLLIGGAIKIALTFIMIGIFVFVRWINSGTT